MAGPGKNGVDSKPDAAMFLAIELKVVRHAVRAWERILARRNSGLDQSTLPRICKLTKLIVTQRRADAWSDVTAERMVT